MEEFHDDEDGLGVPMAIGNGCLLELLVLAVPTAVVALIMWWGWF